MAWGHLCVLLAPRPMWREAEGGVGTFVTLMLTTTIPKTKPDQIHTS